MSTWHIYVNSIYTSTTLPSLFPSPKHWVSPTLSFPMPSTVRVVQRNLEMIESLSTALKAEVLCSMLHEVHFHFLPKKKRNSRDEDLAKWNNISARFSWNKGSDFPFSATFWGPRSCEVAMIRMNMLGHYRIFQHDKTTHIVDGRNPAPVNSPMRSTAFFTAFMKICRLKKNHWELAPKDVKRCATCIFHSVAVQSSYGFFAHHSTAERYPGISLGEGAPQNTTFDMSYDYHY